jgi:pyruvate dehydrogenase E2 component (dihydrolipoamide acetyltransferase)
MQTVRLPSLGETVEQAVFGRWLLSPGDRVEAGAPLAEVLADKATIVLEAPGAGTLRHCCAEGGDLVPADGILGYLGEPEEELPEAARAVAYPKAPAAACLRYRPALDAPPPLPAAEPLGPMRQVVAHRMRQSKAEAPHFYVQTSIDMGACVALRQRLKKEERLRVSYNDMILRACALALRKHPQVAALYTPEGYVRREGLHVGFAVAVEPDGLVVPVLRNADRLPLRELSARARDLAERARAQRLLPQEFSGSVFTVSNLGAFEVDAFTAIINPGESAILAVGKVQDLPVAEKGEVRVRPRMTAILSSDHRVIDGVLAARFNGTVKKLLEAPEALLDAPA